MENKKVKLIVLIMIGVCVILLGVCIFTLISFKNQSENVSTSATLSNVSKEENAIKNETNKNDVNVTNTTKKKKNENTVKNKVKENNTVNKVEIVDTSEKEKTSNTLNVDEWIDNNTTFIGVELDTYEKEVTSHKLIDDTETYEVEYSLEEDFPLKLQDSEYGLESIDNYMSDDLSVAMVVRAVYSNDFMDHLPEAEDYTADGYTGFEKVKINHIPGMLVAAEYEGKQFCNSTWIIKNPDDEGKVLVVTVDLMKNNDSANDFDIYDFVVSDDFNYFIASFEYNRH